jgi:hypothetical protein
LQEAIRLFEKQHPEWLPETGAGKEITNMAKRLPWGHKSRHCIYCGKAGPRTMVVGGWAHKRCLFPPVLPRGEGIRRKVKTPPSGTSAGKEKGDA